MRAGRPRAGALALAAVFALALALTGCVTSGEGERMRSDISKLKQRLDALDRRDADINEQVERLRKVLDQATALLARNSADVGAKVARSEQDIAALGGRIEEAKHLLEELQKKLGEQNARLASIESTQSKIVDRVAPSIPDDKEALWKEAQSRLAGGMRDDARRFFRAFIQRFPQDPRAARAQVQIGQSFAVEGKHTQAAAEYSKLLEVYPKAPEIPEAMWLLAQSFAELKFCSDARAVLQDLTKRFPKAAQVGDARNKLRELQRIAKDKKLCTS